MGFGIVTALRHYHYVHNTLPSIYKRQCKLAKNIRKKEKIKVLFILTSVGSWKTERLYLEMKLHPRFAPYILITEANDEDETKELSVYLSGKGYDFRRSIRGENLTETIKPDIIFYQKPYEYYPLDENLKFYNYQYSSVLCYVTYGFHNSNNAASNNDMLQNTCFQNYFENTDVADEIAAAVDGKGKNFIVTGLPPADEYLEDKSLLVDPWRKQESRKKRIIYAPHHSLPQDKGNWLHYSTFMNYGEAILSLAEKYKDQVQFAFKPHPLLRGKLEKYMGKEWTTAYFNKWASLPNCQIEDGKYAGLFRYSDAMIHDCGSFMAEYHYTENPVMYLVTDEKRIRSILTHYCQRAFDIHYKGRDIESIEQFIKNVIDGVDPLKQQRKDFVHKYLLPPKGETATRNIIDAILGE